MLNIKLFERNKFYERYDLILTTAIYDSVIKKLYASEQLR